MNRQLKELAEQAGYPDYMTYGQDKVSARFAELIVRECCNRLGEETILHDGYGYNQHELYNRLRKHFGVEA
jgi:hypothetical protein